MFNTATAEETRQPRPQEEGKEDLGREETKEQRILFDETFEEEVSISECERWLKENGIWNPGLS